MFLYSAKNAIMSNEIAVSQHGNDGGGYEKSYKYG